MHSYNLRPTPERLSRRATMPLYEPRIVRCVDTCSTTMCVCMTIFVGCVIYDMLLVAILYLYTHLGEVLKGACRPFDPCS